MCDGTLILGMVDGEYKVGWEETANRTDGLEVEDGVDDGLFEGWDVGTADVGIDVWWADGIGVGRTVDRTDGLEDGVDDGLSEGRATGAPKVGVKAIWADGLDVWRTVDRTDGLEDGVDDGMSEGRVVGMANMGIEVGCSEVYVIDVDWVWG